MLQAELCLPPPPQNSDVEILMLKVTVFGSEVHKAVIKVK